MEKDSESAQDQRKEDVPDDKKMRTENITHGDYATKHRPEQICGRQISSANNHM